MIPATKMRPRQCIEERTVHQWLAEARRTGRKDGYLGKRRYPRFTWQEPATVVVCDESRDVVLTGAVTRDISIGGLGLRCRRAIDVNALVRVSIGNESETVEGCVRHCTGTVGGYLIGVEFLIPEPPSGSRARSA